MFSLLIRCSCTNDSHKGDTNNDQQFFGMALCALNLEFRFGKKSKTHPYSATYTVNHFVYLLDLISWMSCNRNGVISQKLEKLNASLDCRCTL